MKSAHYILEILPAKAATVFKQCADALDFGGADFFHDDWAVAVVRVPVVASNKGLRSVRGRS